MKNISIFASDKIRLHPNALTPDGMSIATEPYLILNLDVPEQEINDAIRQCLDKAGKTIPSRAWRDQDAKDYYQKLGVRSQKALGVGADVTEENGIYTVIPIDKQGEFGAPRRVKEERLFDTVKSCLGLAGRRG